MKAWGILTEVSSKLNNSIILLTQWISCFGLLPSHTDVQENGYSILEQDLAHFTRAIGHPARVSVLLTIARRGGLIDGEIIDVPALSQATVIQHLRELKRAGLIHGRIFGSRARYGIDFTRLKEFTDRFHEFEQLVSALQNPGTPPV